MSVGLVVVLAVAALAPLVAMRLRLPGALLEIVAGIVLGPAVLGLVRPDATLNAVALLGLSFLLFLAGSEVDLRSSPACWCAPSIRTLSTPTPSTP